MTNNDSQSAPSSKPARADLLKTITALCNELDKLMLLHEFYYQAAECIFGDEGCYDFAHRIQIKHSAQCFIVMNGAMLVKSTKQHKQQHDPRIIALVKLLARGAAAADIQAECQNNPHGEKPCNESPSTPDIPRTSSETVA